MFEEVKAHVGRHKVVYSAGTVIVIAGVAYCIGVRAGSSHTLCPSIFGINNKLDQTVINLVNRPGPPSWVTYWVEKDLEFMSQEAVSEATGLSTSHISKQLNGKRPPVPGVTLIRRGLAA